MPSIFENILEVERLLDTIFDLETGEVDEEKEQELLQLKEQLISSGLEKLCNLRADKKAFIKAMKDEEDRISAKRKQEEKKLASLDDYILLIHSRSGQKKSVAGTWTVSTRQSTQVIVTDPNFADKRFFRTETVEKLDKEALKKVLATGEIVQGAALQTNINLQVK